MGADKSPEQRAIDLLERMLRNASWYRSAIELSGFDGEDWYDEAVAIMREAGRADGQTSSTDCG